VSGGVATFNNLSINNTGNSYTLTASSGSLTGTTSGELQYHGGQQQRQRDRGLRDERVVVQSSAVGRLRRIAPPRPLTTGPTGWTTTAATIGSIATTPARNSMRRHGVGVAQVRQRRNGRAYFGFGASSIGTLSIVAAPNTGQLILQQNLNYGYADLAAVSQSYLGESLVSPGSQLGHERNHRRQALDSNGTTLLKSVTATTTAITSGGIAFRSTGNDKYYDTVTRPTGQQLCPASPQS